MKKFLKVILIIIASILILLGLMVVISLVSYWKENSLQKEKFKTLPTETVEIASFDEYKEINDVGGWGFGFPSKQVVFLNNKPSTPCWTLGSGTDFLFSSSVKRKSYGALYKDKYYAKADFEFPQLNTDLLSSVSLSDKTFAYAQHYDADNRAFFWNEDATVISCNFNKEELADFSALLDKSKMIQIKNENDNWYVSDNESGYVLCHDNKPYGFIIRMYFNGSDSLYNEEYMLCKTDKGRYIVIEGEYWSFDYPINHAYMLSKDFDKKLDKLLENSDFCKDTENVFDEGSWSDYSERAIIRGAMKDAEKSDE